MTVVSSKEFATNQKKYYGLAVNENIIIKRGKNMFHLIYAPVEEYPEQPILEPDDDFYRAISAEEFRERLTVVLDKIDNSTLTH